MRSLPFLLVTCLALMLCISPVVRDVSGRDGAGGHRVRGHGGQQPGAGTGVERAGGDRAAEKAAGVRRGAYSYGRSPHQRLIAYSAPGAARTGPRRTGVLVVHGGFWYQQRSAGWNRWAGRVAATGPVVFSLDYRPNTEAPWPAQRTDVLRALRWVRERAGRFGVDPEKLVLLGSSAGGQVAAAAGAYGAGRHRLAGVVALSPVADPYSAWRTRRAPGGDTAGMRVLRANAERLAGCDPSSARRAAAGADTSRGSGHRGHAEDDGRRRGSTADRHADEHAPERVGRHTGERARDPELCLRVWRDMSAARRASGADDPPMLLVHSRHDFVPVAHSEALRAAEVRRGMPEQEVTVMTVPGAMHGGGLLKAPGVERTVLSWIAARTATLPAPFGHVRR